jgi:hypothetical protein
VFVCVFVEVVIVAVSIFIQGAEKLMFVRMFVCGGGDSGSINFYTGCRKTNVCVNNTGDGGIYQWGRDPRWVGGVCFRGCQLGNIAWWLQGWWAGWMGGWWAGWRRGWWWV